METAQKIKCLPNKLKQKPFCNSLATFIQTKTVILYFADWRTSFHFISFHSIFHSFIFHDAFHFIFHFHFHFDFDFALPRNKSRQNFIPEFMHSSCIFILARTTLCFIKKQIGKARTIIGIKTSTPITSSKTGNHEIIFHRAPCPKLIDQQVSELSTHRILNGEGVAGLVATKITIDLQKSMRKKFSYFDLWFTLKKHPICATVNKPCHKGLIKTTQIKTNQSKIGIITFLNAQPSLGSYPWAFGNSRHKNKFSDGDMVDDIRTGDDDANGRIDPNFFNQQTGILKTESDFNILSLSDTKVCGILYLPTTLNSPKLSNFSVKSKI